MAGPGRLVSRHVHICTRPAYYAGTLPNAPRLDLQTFDGNAVRKIIHIDMDAFYASVEALDNPELRGKPIVVGGSPESRGVVAAASYEARAFGIHSAMPASRARRLCPQAIFLQPNFPRYRFVSGQIREIFHRYTDLVEPVSLDEAYLDVTENKFNEPSATRIAERIRVEIFAETGLTASAGVSVNKFLAKIASDMRKPNGMYVIRPQDVAGFVRTLPLGKVPGIGKATMATLEQMGLHTCGEMAALPLAELSYRFGKRGAWFYDLARGIDHRPVEATRERKSVSVEDTFPEDHADPAWLEEKLAALCEMLTHRLERAEARGRTVTIKLRTADFQTYTRSMTLEEYTEDQGLIHETALVLFRRSGFVGQPLRLLGVGLSQLEGEEATGDTRQLAFPWAGAG